MWRRHFVFFAGVKRAGTTIFAPQRLVEEWGNRTAQLVPYGAVLARLWYRHTVSVGVSRDVQAAGPCAFRQ